MPTPQQIEVTNIILFFILLGVAFGAIQMSYNSAIEYRDMRQTCQEMGVAPLANGSFEYVPKPVTTRRYAIDPNKIAPN